MGAKKNRAAKTRPRARVPWLDIPAGVVPELKLEDAHDGLWAGLADDLAERVSPHHAAMLAGAIFRPIFDQTIALQLGEPLVRELDLTLDGVEIIEHDVLGKLMRVHRKADFRLDIPAGTSPRRVVPPICVVYGDIFERPSARHLIEAGLVEMLWPVPREWAGSAEQRRAIDQFEWLSFGPYTIGGMPVQYLPLERHDLADLLRQERGGLNDSILDDLDRHLIRAWAVPRLDPLYSELDRAHVVHIEYDYAIWFARPNGASVYRYTIPFWRPVTVRSVQFNLAPSLHSDWILAPAAVFSPFALAHDDARHHPYAQKLEWSFGTETTVPFLAGHGVLFEWQPRSLAPESAKSAPRPDRAS